MTSVGNEVLWAEEKNIVTQAAINAVKKGKKQEEEKLKNGWKYIQVGNTTKILVPCDEDGNPTEDGTRRINKLKEILGIK